MLLTDPLSRDEPVEVTTPERSPTALVPRGTGDDDLEVVAWGGPTGEWLETTVAVRPSPNFEYFIRTMHREGMRPMPHGAGVSLDGSIQGAARTAVMDLFLSAIPPEEPGPESIAVVEEAMGRAAELGDQVLNRDVWSLDRLDVDDRVFALLVLRVPEGFAAVADIGPCFVGAYGRSQPPVWRCTLRPAAELHSSL